MKKLIFFFLIIILCVSLNSCTKDQEVLLEKIRQDSIELAQCKLKAENYEKCMNDINYIRIINCDTNLILVTIKYKNSNPTAYEYVEESIYIKGKSMVYLPFANPSDKIPVATFKIAGTSISQTPNPVQRIPIGGSRYLNNAILHSNTNTQFDCNVRIPDSCKDILAPRAVYTLEMN